MEKQKKKRKKPRKLNKQLEAGMNNSLRTNFGSL